MPEGGTVTVSLREVVLDEAAVVALGALSPGRYAELAVSDTGTGMPPEVAKKAFDPFFTTKPVGQGTGLGLSICYGIVDKLGGRIEVESRVREGSIFTLSLPIESSF